MHNLSKTHLPTFPPEFTFHIGCLRKVKKEKKKTRGGSGRREEAEDDGWLLWGGPDVLSIHFKADMSKLH